MVFGLCLSLVCFSLMNFLVCLFLLSFIWASQRVVCLLAWYVCVCVFVFLLELS